METGAGKGYEDLQVWREAMELVVACYQLTRRFPKSETFGLSNQLQRAAVSVPSNIAEGQARRSRAEFARFLLIASGSLAEVETQLLIATRLNYVSADASQITLSHAAKVGLMLQRLRHAITPS